MIVFKDRLEGQRRQSCFSEGLAFEGCTCIQEEIIIRRCTEKLSLLLREVFCLSRKIKNPPLFYFFAPLYLRHRILTLGEFHVIFGSNQSGG